MMRGEVRTVEGHCSCRIRVPGSIIGAISLGNTGLMGLFIYFFEHYFQ